MAVKANSAPLFQVSQEANVPLRTKSTEGSVATLSEALGELSRQIASAVRAIEDRKEVLVKDTR